MPGVRRRGKLRRTVAAALTAFICGCGGSGEDLAGTADLGVRAVWEQPSLVEASDASGAVFGPIIPRSVLAVRFLALHEQSGEACCLAILRGPATFETRAFFLTRLPSGPVTLRADAYPQRAAPADGIATTCSTDPPGVGVACTEGADPLPTFTSVPLSVTVLPNERNDAGILRFLSTPFLIERDPEPGGSVLGPRPRIAMTVVDGLHHVRDDLRVSLFVPSLGQEVDVLADSLERCDDRSGDPECSEDGELDVTGIRFEGRPAPGDAVPAGVAVVRVHTGNDADPPRDLFTSYPIEVLPGDTTTTTTTTLSTTTTVVPTTTLLPPTTTLPPPTTTTLPPTTTTTLTPPTTTTTVGPVTTTTLPAAVFCVLRFSVPESESLATLNFRFDYPLAEGAIVGTGPDTSCRTLVAVDSSAILNGDVKRLIASLTSQNGFATPADVVECDYKGPTPPKAGDFVLVTSSATRPDSTPAPVSVLVSTIGCIPASN